MNEGKDISSEHRNSAISDESSVFSCGDTELDSLVETCNFDGNFVYHFPRSSGSMPYS